VTGLAQGIGNDMSKLPTGAFAGQSDLFDTGVTADNNYGEPCAPTGDPAHRYTFTLYALAVVKLEMAGAVLKTVTPALFSFGINKALNNQLLGKESFTATFGR
jgi:phosphatidylethanolamine-binding protein (PEBP) family uncharacterized protein